MRKRVLYDQVAAGMSNLPELEIRDVGIAVEASVLNLDFGADLQICDGLKSCETYELEKD